MVTPTAKLDSTSHELRHVLRLAPFSAAMSAAWALGAAVASLLLPAVSARALDRALSEEFAGPALAALAALLIVRVVALICGDVSQSVASARTLVLLRDQVLRHVFLLGVLGTRGHPAGDVTTRITGNAAAAADSVPTVVTATAATAVSLGGLCALFAIDWRLGAVFLSGLLPAMLLLRRLMRLVTGSYADYLERLAAIATRLTDALAGSRTIRASGTERSEVRRVLDALPALTRAGNAMWGVQRSAAWPVGLVLMAIRVLVLVVAGLSFSEGRISAGEFVAASLYVGLALNFLAQADNVLRIGHARANARRVLDLLAEEPETLTRTDVTPWASQLPRGPGAVSVQDVSVRLGEQTVLDRVSLEIPGGTAVALVGHSGSGKTTLAMVVGRLLDPDHGIVRLDGVRVSDLDPARLRREVAYAFDRPVLFGETVAEAIGYGSDASRDEIVAAARTAGADSFVGRLPEGFDTPLSRSPLSGGELQRLGLARAVVHGGRLLVLDDATCSLDTVTEARISSALTVELRTRTRLLVAHRVATAARADTVAWLERGRILRTAPHQALWDEEPRYRAVFTGAALDEEDAA